MPDGAELLGVIKTMQEDEAEDFVWGEEARQADKEANRRALEMREKQALESPLEPNPPAKKHALDSTEQLADAEHPAKKKRN